MTSITDLFKRIGKDSSTDTQKTDLPSVSYDDSDSFKTLNPRNFHKGHKRVSSDANALYSSNPSSLSEKMSKISLFSRSNANLIDDRVALPKAAKKFVPQIEPQEILESCTLSFFLPADVDEFNIQNLSSRQIEERLESLPKRDALVQGEGLIFYLVIEDQTVDPDLPIQQAFVECFQSIPVETDILKSQEMNSVVDANSRCVPFVSKTYDQLLDVKGSHHPLMGLKQEELNLTLAKSSQASELPPQDVPSKSEKEEVSNITRSEQDNNQGVLFKNPERVIFFHSQKKRLVCLIKKKIVVNTRDEINNQNIVLHSCLVPSTLLLQQDLSEEAAYYGVLSSHYTEVNPAAKHVTTSIRVFQPLSTSTWYKDSGNFRFLQLRVRNESSEVLTILEASCYVSAKPLHTKTLYPSQSKNYCVSIGETEFPIHLPPKSEYYFTACIQQLSPLLSYSGTVPAISGDWSVSWKTQSLVYPIQSNFNRRLAISAIADMKIMIETPAYVPINSIFQIFFTMTNISSTRKDLTIDILSKLSTTSQGGVVCLDKSLYLGGIKPEKTLSFKLNFIGLRKGVFPIEEVNFKDAASGAYYVLNNCPDICIL